MSERSKYKRSKMGHLPGNISKGKKVAMLEGENTNVAKSYRKDFQKKANRKFRHNKGTNHE